MSAFDQTVQVAGHDAPSVGMEEKTLAEVAREELLRTGWDVELAIPAMVARVKADDLLLARMARGYLVSVEGERRITQRAAIRAASNAHMEMDRSQRGSRVHALAAGNARMLLDWPLPDGTKLRDATKGKLRTVAEEQYKKGSTMCWDAHWYALIAGKMPEGNKRVASVLDEAALQKLREKAQHAKR